MYIFIHTKCSDKTTKNKRKKSYNVSVSVRAFKLKLHNVPQNNNVNEYVLHTAIVQGLLCTYLDIFYLLFHHLTHIITF